MGVIHSQSVEHEDEIKLPVEILVEMFWELYLYSCKEDYQLLTKLFSNNSYIVWKKLWLLVAFEPKDKEALSC